MHAVVLRVLFLGTCSTPDTPIAGAPPLSGWNTGEVYTLVNSLCGEPTLDLCVLCSDGHVIVRDGQETCVEDGLNGLTLNRFNEQLAVLCQ